MERAIRENEVLLRSVFDASELFIAVVELTESSFRYVLANKATLDFYGLGEDAANFDAREIGIPADEVAAWRQTMLDVWESGCPRTMEYTFDGGVGLRWYVGTYSPLPDSPTGAKRLAFVVVDITARKESQDRQRLLMLEIDHRAKNALAVAQAIVQLTQAEDAKTFKKSVVGRIASLARTHTLLAEERWKGAELRRLIEAELVPFKIEGTARFWIEGPTYLLDPAAAQSMGFVFHELGTNAVKYGALASPEGGLVVTWTVDGSGLHLTWRETGGKGIASDLKSGFGFSMLDQTIKGQLRGEWRIKPTQGGIVCLIDLPADVSPKLQAMIQ